MEICSLIFFPSLTKGKIIYLNVSSGELNYLMRYSHIKVAVVAVNGFLYIDMEVFHSLIKKVTEVYPVPYFCVMMCECLPGPHLPHFMGMKAQKAGGSSVPQ